jgi:hypothetical protein
MTIDGLMAIGDMIASRKRRLRTMRDQGRLRIKVK